MRPNHIFIISPDLFLAGIIELSISVHVSTPIQILENELKAIQLFNQVHDSEFIVIYDNNPLIFGTDIIKRIEGHEKLSKLFILGENFIDHSTNSNKTRLIKKQDLPAELNAAIVPLFSHSKNLSDYCPIRLEIISKFEGIRKNLFIKIGSDRMVQIFKEDKSTTIDDLIRLKSKGVEILYLKRSTSEILLSSIQRQIKIYLKGDNFKFIFKDPLDEEENSFERRFLRIRDEIFIDEEFLVILQECIHMVRTKVAKERRIDLFLSELFQMPGQFKLFCTKFELTIVISLIISKELGWFSTTVRDKLIYAAIICDITLATKEHLLKIRDLDELKISNLSDSDYKLYMDHPKDGASLIRNFFTNSPASVDVIIEQHHELPTGKGFPSGIKSETFFQLSAVFAVANDISHQICFGKVRDVRDYLDQYEGRWGSMIFRDITSSLRRVLKSI
jgi:hypothetical protein